MPTLPHDPDDSHDRPPRPVAGAAAHHTRSALVHPWRAEAWGGTVRQVIGSESAGGMFMGLAALAAMLWANTGPGAYQSFFGTKVGWLASATGIATTPRSLVDNVLMPVFFLAIGLEIGRERAVGALHDTRNAILPALAALGGMAGGALVYLALSGALGAGRTAQGGWGVPMATDVAFALGALGLLGDRVPRSLRIFVLTLAVADDLASVVVLAVVGTSRVHVVALLGALGVVALTALGCRLTGKVPALPLIGAVALGAYLLDRAGVEPALAGAFVGMAASVTASRRGAPGRPTRAPSGSRGAPGPPTSRSGSPPTSPPTSRSGSPGEHLEGLAQGVSSFLVLPLFALANAGVTVTASLTAHHDPRSVLIALSVARVVGKMGGIWLAAALLVRTRWAALPFGVTWRQFAGAAAMCGIGFTVPLLFAARAFAGAPLLLAASRLGLLTGSAGAFVVGAAILALPARSRQSGRPAGPAVPDDL